MAVHAPRRPACMDFQLAHFVSEASEKMLIRKHQYRQWLNMRTEKAKPSITHRQSRDYSLWFESMSSLVGGFREKEVIHYDRIKVISC